MKSKERVIRAIEFRSPDRVPLCTLHIPTRSMLDAIRVAVGFKNDIMLTSVIIRHRKLSKTTAVDPWGAVWASLGNKGEVIESPLTDWDNLSNVVPPDYLTKNSVRLVKLSRKLTPNKFLIGNLPDMIFSRMHYLRGYMEFMMDLCLEQEKIEQLADIIVAENCRLIEFYATCGIDGVMGADDLGLQDRLMINPVMWREIFKPRYKAMIDCAHKYNMKFVLHSCGYIFDIIEDFIEIGLDVLQCDQQDNMGIDRLNNKFGGRITFFSPTDIQTTLSTNDEEKIINKAQELRNSLGAHNGGLIGKVYSQPKDIGATERSVRIMLKAFRD